MTGGGSGSAISGQAPEPVPRVSTTVSGDSSGSVARGSGGAEAGSRAMSRAGDIANLQSEYTRKVLAVGGTGSRPKGDDCPWYEHMGGNLYGVYAVNKCTSLPSKIDSKIASKVKWAGAWNNEVEKRRIEVDRLTEEFNRRKDEL